MPNFEKHFGRVEDLAVVRREVDRVLGFLPQPLFYAAAYPIKDTGAGKVVLLYKFITQYFGGKFPTHKQTIGDCVSHGHGLGVDILKAAQIQAGAKESFTGETATEIIYAGSRVEIGNGQCGTQDGSVGAWAAGFVTKYGTVIRDKYPVLDLTTYNGQTAKKLGMPNAGVPDPMEPFCKEHPIKTASLVRNYNEARDAIANGYPVPVCSQVGFENQGQSTVRDKDGFARRGGKWPHCFPPGTLVDGPVPNVIEAVRSGSVVYSADGIARTVIQKHERWLDGALIRIKTIGLPAIRASDEHPILVYRPTQRIIGWRHELPILDDPHLSGEGRSAIITATATKKSGFFAYVPAGELTKGDYLCIPKIPATANAVIPEWPEHDRCSCRLNRLQATALLAWWFGLYAADGTAYPGHRVGFTLTPTDDIGKCVEGFRVFGIEPRVEDYGTYVRVIGDHAGLADAMHSWFGGGRKQEKRLPPWLLTWDLREVVAGFRHGDGGEGRDPRGIAFNYIDTSSKALFTQFFRILATLGFYPMAHTTRPNRPGAFANAKVGYRINWRNSPLRKSGRHIGNFYVLPISKVTEEPYCGPVYNLEVEDAHSYIAAVVAVHNCMLFCGVDDEFGRPGLLCVNSWGDTGWISGPTRHDQPGGSFWVDAETCDSMLGEGDSFAISGYVGYPVQGGLEYMLI
jgi:hypothetical protein